MFWLYHFVNKKKLFWLFYLISLSFIIIPISYNERLWYLFIIGSILLLYYCLCSVLDYNQKLKEIGKDYKSMDISNGSVSFNELKKLVDEYDKYLYCSDKRFNGTVIVAAKHGLSYFVFRDAFALRTSHNGDIYYIVFSEHEGSHIYCADEYKVSFFSKESKIKNFDFKSKSTKAK